MKELKPNISIDVCKLLEAATEVGPMYGKTKIDSVLFTYVSLGDKENFYYRVVNTFLSVNEIERIHSALGVAMRVANNMFVISQPPVKKEDERFLPFSDDFEMVLSLAEKYCEEMGHPFVTSDHILLAIFEKIPDIGDIFRFNGLSSDIIRENMESFHEIASLLDEKGSGSTENAETKSKAPRQPKKTPKKKTPFIITFDAGSPGGDFNGANFFKKQNDESDVITDITAKVEKKEVTPLIGRKSELEKITTVLNRRDNNNVVLVGEHGVGKTKIVEGLAKKLLVEGSSSRIYLLNLGGVMAGTNLRGQLEEKFMEVMSQLENKTGAIALVDNIQQYFTKKNENEFEPLLNSIFENPKIQCIITASPSGYKSIFEDNEFSNRFQKILIDPSTVEETKKIVNGIKSAYEKYHMVTYSEDVVDAIVKMSDRYIVNDNLPSSAMNIMDEVGARKKLSVYMSSKMQDLLRRISENNDKVSDLKGVSSFDDTVKSIESETEALRNEYVKELEASRQTDTDITLDDVYDTISRVTAIPVNKISVSEKKTIVSIADKLKSFVVGQDKAMDAIAQSIKRSKVGLFPSNRPVATFFFEGPTGCGKTLSAKILAREIYGSENFLIRFDMSEYSNETAVNKLIGSSAGYVGYEKGGLLTEAVKNKRYSVLLIDEIEKANPEIYNVFLQVLDEGFLTDNTGRKIDFRNTIIIFTSNIGAHDAAKVHGLGFASTDKEAKEEVIDKALKKRFPPEFINRLDEIICFNKLSDDDIKKIIGLELESVKTRIDELGVSLHLDESVKDYLLKIVAKDKDYGARPVIRAIQKEVENKVADIMLETEEVKTIKVTVENGKLLFSKE